jgi:ribonuclease HII
MTPDFEKSYGQCVAGVDEVGRGPLAGPVMACAFTFLAPPLRGGGWSEAPSGGAPFLADIRDSKQLSAPKREEIAEQLHHAQKAGQCAFAIAEATVEEIDHVNILQATFLAMQRAVSLLHHKVPTLDHLLIDGNRLPALPLPATAIVKGDSKSMSIAAASILAKVARDRLMTRLSQEHPHYGWETNAGYGTATHLAALHTHGITRWHRKSFAPVAACLSPADIHA